MALQMTWQPSLLHHRRKNGPPLGLRNLGNSCYLNSVLQCLTYTPPLANFCLNNQHSSNCDSAIDSEQKRDCPFCILERRIVRSLSVDHPQDAPVRISKCLRIFAEHFRSGRQEDAHEFLRYVIDACHNTCLRLKKLQQQRRKVGLNNRGEGFNSSTVVKEIFGGCLQSQVKCLSCGNESNKVDEIMDISLDVLQSGSVKESLQNFFQPEVLDGNNKYKCENCKKLVAARKQMSIFQAPNVLVIQLKRFEGIFGGKIDKAIAFEEVLVLSSYVCKASQDPHPEYHLFGTIVHSGFSPDSGHYYAYIKDAMGRWYCCNDSYVSLSSLQEVLSEKAYIIFFSRTKQRPVTASTVSVSNGVKSQDSNGILPSKVLKSAGPIQTMHTQQFVDHSSGKENSTVSKVDKISSFGNSTATKFPASVNGKIVFNKIQSNGKNGVVRASTCMEKSEKDITSSISSNGIDKRKTVDAVDGENSPGFHLYQSNKKNGDVNTSICRENGEKDVTPLISSNGICNGKTVDAVNGENSQGFPLNQSNKKNGDARASACRENGGKDMTPLISSNGVFKGKAVDGENSQGFPLNQSKERNGDVSASISGEKSEKHMALLRSSNSICKSKAVDETDGENIQESPLKCVEVKGLRTTLNSTGADISGNSDKRNRVMLESGNNHNEPLNGGHTTDGLKRKSRAEDSCILFAKDDHTRTELAELKLVLGNEASLVLRSCGWSDEVHSFMHLKKKFCAQELGNSASNVHELKKSLIRHAKLTFLSQIPESLKETLIERLKIAGEGKQHPRPSASKQGARYSTSPN